MRRWVLVGVPFWSFQPSRRNRKQDLQLSVRCIIGYGRELGKVARLGSDMAPQALALR